MPETGIDVMTLLAYTDGEDSWYGGRVDTRLYSVSLEQIDETGIYVKITKRWPPEPLYEYREKVIGENS